MNKEISEQINDLVQEYKNKHFVDISSYNKEILLALLMNGNLITTQDLTESEVLNKTRRIYFSCFDDTEPTYYSIGNLMQKYGYKTTINIGYYYYLTALEYTNSDIDKEWLNDFLSISRSIKKGNYCYKRERLNIDKNTLISLGVKKKNADSMLDKILEMVKLGKLDNDKDILFLYVKNELIKDNL